MRHKLRAGPLKHSRKKDARFLYRQRTEMIFLCTNIGDVLYISIFPFSIVVDVSFFGEQGQGQLVKGKDTGSFPSAIIQAKGRVPAQSGPL